MKSEKVSQRQRRLKDDGALTDDSAHLEARSWEEVAQAGKEDLLMSRRASGNGGVPEDPAEAVGAQNGHAPDCHHSGGRGGRRVQELSHFLLCCTHCCSCCPCQREPLPHSQLALVILGWAWLITRDSAELGYLHPFASGLMRLVLLLQESWAMPGQESC